MYIDINDNMAYPICTYKLIPTALGSQSQPIQIASEGAEDPGTPRLWKITKLLAGAI